MDWQYLKNLSWGVLWNANSIILSISTYISLLISLVLWLWPKKGGKKMKNTFDRSRKVSALLFMALVLVSVVLTSHSLYVARPSTFAAIPDLIPSVLQNKNVRLVDLAMQDPIVRNRTFEDCQIYGPAVLVPERCVFYQCHMDTAGDAGFIKTTNERLWGVLRFEGCVFRRCSFYKIGFIGPPEAIDRLRSQVTLVDGPMP